MLRLLLPAMQAQTLKPDAGLHVPKVWWTERDPARPGLGAFSGFVPPRSFAPLVKSVREAVVVISTRNAGSSRSLGSGFVVTPKGLLVTNEHVIHNAQRIFVRLSDGREFEARVLGKDSQSDLAVLQVVADSPLPVARLGDSDALEVGDWVMAMGAPFQLDASVTQGIVSGLERHLSSVNDQFLQISAQINPGNSGGPLFNMRGEVVGVTTSVLAEGQGIGFAVPINLVKEVLPNLIDNGTLDRGWMGLTLLEDRAVKGAAVVVAAVSQDSPAAKAGLTRNDRLLAVQGHAATSYQQVVRGMSTLPPGAVVKLKIQRGVTVFEVSVTLGVQRERQMRPMTGLGVEVYAEEGVLRVGQVASGGVGERAGFVVGDEVEALNGQPLSSLEELGLALAASSNELIVRLRHLGHSKTIGIRLNKNQ